MTALVRVQVDNFLAKTTRSGVLTVRVSGRVDNFLAKTTRSGVLIRKTKRSRENRTALLAVAAAMEDVHLRQFRFAKLAAAKQAAVRLLPTRFNCLKCGWPIPLGTSSKPKNARRSEPLPHPPTKPKKTREGAGRLAKTLCLRRRASGEV